MLHRCVAAWRHTQDKGHWLTRGLWNNAGVWTEQTVAATGEGASMWSPPPDPELAERKVAHVLVARRRARCALSCRVGMAVAADALQSLLGGDGDAVRLRSLRKTWVPWFDVYTLLTNAAWRTFWDDPGLAAVALKVRI